jgi:L-alanine-DL-glutamate epimerase-like enolase superfamily enzyme
VKIWRQARNRLRISAINPWRGRLASNPLVVREGFIEPNDEPGLGLTIDEDMLAD